MTNTQNATTSIARKAISASLYSAARVAAADIAILSAEYGQFAQRKIAAVSADSPVEVLIKVAEDLVVIADRIDREEPAPDVDAGADVMTVDTTYCGTPVTLTLEVKDLSELIYRCGWTITDDIQGMTDQGRTELKRLESLDGIESGLNSSEDVRAWFAARTVAR